MGFFLPTVINKLHVPPCFPRRKTDEAFQDLLEALKLSPQNHDIRRALEQLRDESTLMGISGGDKPFERDPSDDCKGFIVKRSFGHDRLTRT